MLTLVAFGLARALTTGLASGVVILAATVIPPVTVLVVIAVQRPPRPAPWFMVAAALTLATVHNVLWFVQVPLGGAAEATGPASSVTLLLAHMTLLAAAITVVVPIARGDGGSIVDSAIVAVSGAGILWSLVLEPALERQDAGPDSRALSLVLVLLVCGTAGAVARAAVAAREARATLGYFLLGALAMVAASVTSTASEPVVTRAEASIRDILWICAFFAVAAAASHPSRTQLRSPGPVSVQTLTLPHLVVLGVAVCSNLLLAGVLELSGRGSDPALLITGSLLVVPLLLVRVWQIAGLFASAQSELVRQARHDELTGLPNRRAATAHLAATTQQVEDGVLAGARVCFLDLDDFKAINDEHGHAAGDRVLVDVADRLRTSVGPDDFVARLGGDEFVVVLPCDSDEAEMLTVTRIRGALADPVRVGETPITVGVSIGSVVVSRGHDITVERVLSLADAQMYVDKRRGPSRTTTG